MERGYEQLIFLALFLVAALLDWLVRWLKRTRRPDTPTDDLPADDAQQAADRDWMEEQLEEEARLEELARLEDIARREEAARLEEIARWEEAARLEQKAQAQARVKERPVRKPAVEELMVRRPAQSTVIGPARVVRRRGNARLQRLLRDPASMRQAIVAMEVLGPCRGLEHNPLRTSSSSPAG